MPTFRFPSNYKRFIKTMLYYQIEGPKPRFSFFNPTKTILNPTKKIVDIVCYCLMPNHFHFLIKQLRPNGISEFVGKLSNSYTKYFNIKHKRSGPLFQGQFKAVHIESNEQLLHLSRYIHLNPLVSYVTRSLEKYPWSSYPEYVNLSSSNISSKEIILEQFRSIENYKQFVIEQEDYGKKLELIKHQLLE